MAFQESCSSLAAYDGYLAAQQHNYSQQLQHSSPHNHNHHHHRHHQVVHPRDHHHHHHHHNLNHDGHPRSSSEDEDEDVFLDNLPSDDVESILAPSISRTQSTYRQSTAHPHLPSSANARSTPGGVVRDPSPPKKALFASQGKAGGLGVLSQTKFFRPRSSSVGNADQTGKEQGGDQDKWVSKLPSFNLSSLPLPQLPSFGSNTKDGADKEKPNTRGKRAGSMIMDSLAKAAAGMSNHFATSSPGHGFNPPANIASKKVQPPPRQTVNSSSIIAHDFARPAADTGLRRSTEATIENSYRLRRSNSDSSSLRRTISRTSSIGSDTRFLDVREQTNARYKAIKDSILPDIKDSFTFNTPALVKKATSGNLAALNQPPDPLDMLSGDVVIMGGYRGSILKKVKPSFTTPGEKRIGKTLWIPVKVGFNLQIVDLEVPLDPEAELLMEEKVIATDMLSNLAGVDISHKKTGEDLPIDLYDPAVWQEYNISPCVSPTNKVTLSTGLLSTASVAMASVLREGKDVREKLSRWSPSTPALLSGEGNIRKQSRDDVPAAPPTTAIPDTSDAPDLATLTAEIQDIAATGAGAVAPNMTTPFVGSNAQNGCTLPLSVTLPYLKNTLAETKKFRAELAFQPSLAEQYPPFAVLYSKTTPTVKSARVNGYEGIKTTNYTDLLFGAGDATSQCIAALLDARERNKRRLLRTLGRNTGSSA
ncbi:hypothetical protein ABW20_dc0103079 [Dactylellina cionopaga]|nr:hypothetical protein ABW20_dc0103079 [Dactylellina cionopaga]